MISLRKSTTVKSVIIATAVAAFAFTALPAQAGGMHFGSDRPMMSDDAMGDMGGVGVGLAIGLIGGAIAEHVAHDHDRPQGAPKPQQQLDREWVQLNQQDEVIHGHFVSGYPGNAQREHDCLYAKKVQALLDQMNATLEHYTNDFSPGKTRTDAINSENADIRQVRDVQLPRAKAECAKWYY